MNSKPFAISYFFTEASPSYLGLTGNYKQAFDDFGDFKNMSAAARGLQELTEDKFDVKSWMRLYYLSSSRELRRDQWAQKVKSVASNRIKEMLSIKESSFDTFLSLIKNTLQGCPLNEWAYEQIDLFIMTKPANDKFDGYMKLLDQNRQVVDPLKEKAFYLLVKEADLGSDYESRTAEFSFQKKLFELAFGRLLESAESKEEIQSVLLLWHKKPKYCAHLNQSSSELVTLLNKALALI